VAFGGCAVFISVTFEVPTATPTIPPRRSTVDTMAACAALSTSRVVVAVPRTAARPAATRRASPTPVRAGMGTTTTTTGTRTRQDILDTALAAGRDYTRSLLSST
jgi:hypothetical protein